MFESTTIIAFDQHASAVVATVLPPGHRIAANHPLNRDLPTIGRFVARLTADGPVQCRYKAGPCGFELQRFLTAHNVPGDVIAPAVIPRRPGDRVKTDRRDAASSLSSSAGGADRHSHPRARRRGAPRPPPLS